MLALGAFRAIALAGPWMRNALWKAARAVPSLDLRFADNKSLVDSVTGASLVTFTRASSGTYVGSDGVLRSAVTNLLLQSEAFGTTWTTTGSAVSANSITGPNGLLTADTITEDSSTGDHRINQASLSLSNGFCTYSVYLKAGTGSAARIQFDGTVGGTPSSAVVDINLSTGITSGLTATGNITSGSAVVSTILDGWYRVSLTASLSAAATGISTRIFLLQSAGGASSYAGNGTGSVYIWGAQLEQSATVGEYIPTTSTINSAPRFDHNPTTGESLGLLVEEARTNLIVQSENLGTTWTTTGLLAFGSGSTLNATTAPDGTTTADLVTENTSTSEHRIETAAISWAANTTYTLTIFAKANGRTRMDFFGVGGGNFTGGRNASFNLSTGTVIATEGPVASIEARANGWYRLRMTFTTSAAPSASSLFIRFLDNSNNFSYTGDGTSGIYLWGAQLEAGAFATSYIPTVGAGVITPGYAAPAVTRAADVASITGSNLSSWYNQTEGTVFASGDFVALGTTSFSRIVGFTGANTGTDEISFYTRVNVGSGDGTIFGAVTVNSVLEGDLNGPTGNPNLSSAYRSAIAYKANDFGLSSNGLTPTVDTSGSLPTITQLIIMGNIRFQNRLSGHVRRLTYWPTRLANTTIQAITTP